MTVPRFFNFILDLIFPNVCGICNQISNKSICKKCMDEIVKYKITRKVCKFNKLKQKLKSKIYFDEQIYFYKYQGLIREKIIEYKFGDKPYLYKMFSEMILDEKLQLFCENYDVIIPVPIDKKRMNNRGYNQTYLIAKELVKNLKNIKLENKVLYKSKSIKPQSTMNSKEDRISNIKGVFSISNSYVVNKKRVIIFDDIFTTGSTVNECAKVLKQSGVKKVGIITIAKD